MNDTARDKFFQLVITTDQAAKLNEYFALCLKELFNAKAKPPLEVINEIFPSKIAGVLEESITESKIDPKNPAAIKQALEAFAKAIDAMEEVSLTLAIDPPQKTLSDLSEAVKESFGTSAILALTIDPDILGGAVIVYKGKYLDYSLRKKLTILFEAKKDEIQKQIT